MHMITLSDGASERLAARTGDRWLRGPVLLALSAAAVGGILFMMHAAYIAAAGVFLVVTVVSFLLRTRDASLVPNMDSTIIGQAGEHAVRHVLSDLDARYTLINGLRLRNPAGEVDHILIGPHGLLVIETKAMGGYVSCTQGHWRRTAVLPDGRQIDLPIGNPSRQVQRNARLLMRTGQNQELADVPVHCAVIFTHPTVELALDDPPVPVLPLRDLRSFVDGLPMGTDAQTAERAVALLAPSASASTL